MMTIVLSAAGILLGGFIGYSFGMMQQSASRTYTQRQASGSLRTGWLVMPGSMRRTAYLLLVLAGIQVLCPMFFDGGSVQWLISAGVVLGYGWTLMKQLRKMTSHRA